MLQSRPSFCELHLDEQVDIYCEDCRVIICIICCMVEHKTHNTLDIDKMADKFRQQLQDDISIVWRCVHRANMKQKHVKLNN